LKKKVKDIVDSLLMEKFHPGGARTPRGNFAETSCAICNVIWVTKITYDLQLQGMNRCGGPGWEPLYCCPTHTDFEIEVWKVKTKRRTTL
jgi:hypothetical protein